MTYKVVDKSDSLTCTGKLKWKPVFDSLLETKALRFEYQTKREAELQAAAIMSSLFRFKRLGRVNYSPHYRIIPEEGKFILYLWKETKNDGVT